MGIQDKTRDFEICGCGCGRQTTVRKDTPISARRFYIEGVGQLRPDCYSEIYGPTNTEDARNRIQLDDAGIPTKW